MKATFIKRISRILFLSCLFLSCSSDLDFDQAKDLKLEPVFVTNLAYFDVPATQLINDGSLALYPDVTAFGAFKDEYFTDHLVKTELNFEIENTIIRAFRIDLILLDASNQVLETNSYNVPAFSGTSNVIKFPTEVFEGQRLELLKRTAKLGFLVTMAPGPPLDQNSIGNLKFRSGATVYMKVE
ncbi:hypothetical protein B0A79_01030 [Flavobacterium piscis]|uniref:DUF1735 domain-containing protein n=1 Tax=Flavobacterium piscis TaxID=1114874 RepID=A0ABX2XVQ9_9FLAO|nr:hypothetical protein [Flavobacterium piscis]OCB77085.1 hypothetical protein FLP_03845 [Flavobacterium piscis]OXG08226.1 hypothetical protein B0A79_01030 [Flavobacterium piscis]